MTKKLTFAKFAESFRKGSAVCRRDLQKVHRGKLVACREVEVIPVNADGRCGDPGYTLITDLNGKTLRQLACYAMQTEGATGVAVEIGYDLWENVYEFAHQERGFDYEPRIDHFSMDLPAELIADLPL